MKISVITAVFNNRATIAGALESVLAQRGADVEPVVVDGASTDGTQDVIRRYADRLGRYVSEPDRGLYDALNKGLALATGDVVGFLHSDDFFADNQVLAGVAAAFGDPAVDAVYGDLQYVRREATGHVVRHWRSAAFSPRRLALGWMPPHPTLYVRRGLYARVGGFDTRYRIAADYDLVLRLFQAPGLNAVYLPRVLVKMRVGGVSNRSLRNLVRKSREDLEALRRNGVGGLGTLALKNLSKVHQFLG